MPTIKKCWSCGIEKPLVEFNKETQQKDGHARTCKVCRSENRKKLRELNPERFNAYSKKYRKANPEKYAEWRFKSRHGITRAEALVELEVEKGCRICGVTDFGNEGWVIDHDHSCCGKLNTCNKCRRGILCEPCNKMLGFAKDNIEVLTKAVEYLEEYERSK